MKDVDAKGRLKIGREAVGKKKADVAIKRVMATLAKRAKDKERQQKSFRDSWEPDMRIVESALGKIIGKDEAVRLAMARLRKNTVIEGQVNFSSDYEDALTAPHQESLYALHLHSDVHLIKPPYDYGWEWGYRIDETQNDPATGTIGVKGHSWRVEECAAGIGIVLTTDKPCMVSVRPFITYRWEISLGGYGSGAWADARGGIDAAALVEGAIIEPPGIRWSETFAWYQPGGSKKHSESDVDFIAAPASALSLNFSMVPGKTYSVNFGGWIAVGSGNGWLGLAGALALSQGRVKFVVVERFVV